MIPVFRVEGRRTRKLEKSLGRLGGYAIAFFMVKGIAWLVLPVVLWLAN